MTVSVTVTTNPSRRARALLRRARGLARHALLLVAALAVLLAVVRAGSRFFYCPMADLAFDANPCASEPDPDADDHDAAEAPPQPSLRLSDCCIERWRPAAPTASTPSASDAKVAPAGVVATLPPSRDVDLRIASASPPFDVARAVRAGPPPPNASERRAQLMVFHL